MRVRVKARVMVRVRVRIRVCCFLFLRHDEKDDEHLFCLQAFVVQYMGQFVPVLSYKILKLQAR